eukprot:gene12379-20505_t
MEALEHQESGSDTTSVAPLDGMGGVLNTLNEINQQGAQDQITGLKQVDGLARVVALHILWFLENLEHGK